MKTQRELNVHYWTVIHDMVEAYNKEHSADVKPWECVKYEGSVWSYKARSSQPQFDCSADLYQFAVAILYDEQDKVHKPVFPGDTVYEKLLPFEFTVVDANTLERDALKFKGLDWSKFTWHKPQPKRTFEINGVELPCPVVGGDYIVDINNVQFEFETLDDCVAVQVTLSKLLTEARDKP